jgi:hypothetical protein
MLGVDEKNKVTVKDILWRERMLEDSNVYNSLGKCFPVAQGNQWLFFVS